MPSRDVVVVGAGPAGLQWAVLLQEANIHYTVLEQAAMAGSFFRIYPRGRRLISHNKCHVGAGHSLDFALRHDWHSLLRANLTMCERSAQYYPHADAYASYLSEVAQPLNVVFGARVESVVHGDGGARRSVVRTSDHGDWRCRHVVIATGLAPLPLPPEWQSPAGFTYDNYPELDSTGRHPFCQNRPVAVIGAGNSAFETADLLKACASAVHLFGRSPPRLAALSHYPGHVRYRTAH